MTEAAAKAFATAAAAFKKQHGEISGKFYNRFIVGSEIATEDEIALFERFIDESEKISKAWHNVALGAIAGFGGSQDMVLSGDSTMLNTLKKKLAAAQKHEAETEKKEAEAKKKADEAAKKKAADDKAAAEAAKKKAADDRAAKEKAEARKGKPAIGAHREKVVIGGHRK